VLLVGSAMAIFASPLFELRKYAHKLNIDWATRFAAILLLFAFVWLSYKAAVHFKKLPEAIRRRPQMTLHAIFLMVVLIAQLTKSDPSFLHSLAAALVILLPVVIWRIGYMLASAQAGRIGNTRFRDHLIYIFPAWHGSSTPYGKGIDYLSRFEAKTATDLARSHLAGLKLLLLSLLWWGVLQFFDDVIFGDVLAFSLDFPHTSELVTRQKSSTIAVAWLALYFDLVWQTLKVATNGHLIIGLLRLFGFNVFRNTYKPLLAETLISFWNRYYFYFKELLATFFFYPIFSRWFKAQPKLRLFAAVIASAFFGNLYYHFIKAEASLLSEPGYGVIDGHQSHAFYCLLLAFGLFFSLLRQQNQTTLPAIRAWQRFFRIGCVWTFFGLILIWRGSGSFNEQSEFFLRLFGLNVELATSSYIPFLPVV
jgi:hypothetical protein